MGFFSSIASLFTSRTAKGPLTQAERDAASLENARKWLEAHQVGVAKRKPDFAESQNPLDEVFDIKSAHLPHNIFNRDSH
ncbi:hypothetical protein [Acidovorax sp. sic0104]|uniref:hypothetical protein n=1 Tax=Acidovorax sp. sic0104 TaxID=2854784 RepID=UPI001C48D663|nr:hypothetical protein [Acidovorax sp. sic0104]MBV7542116.1 hypothetical protein [Acidovorax sp. sic0104]